MMRVKPLKRAPGNPGLGKLLPARKTDNLVVDASDEKKVYALVSKKNSEHGVGWHICAAPGTDVLAMIMLGCLLDDMVGWFA